MNSITSPQNYQASGVDIQKGDFFASTIKKMVGHHYQENIVSGIGGFAALYQLGDRYLAIDLNLHNTIGIDLVAMCANDILCTGARPLFFLDYLASSHLDLDISTQIIQGIIQGCDQCQMPLIGGETAEMPGFYPDNHYDLAGFCLGEVGKEDLIEGKNLKQGDLLLGLPSSGFHSNGFSLLRSFLSPGDDQLKKELLTPTKIYTQEISVLKSELGPSLKGLAHITGSGFKNIPRINPLFDYHIEHVPSLQEIPPIFQTMTSRMMLPQHELYQTFNMGIGMVVATDRPHQVESILKDFEISPFLIGHVEEAKENQKEGKLELRFCEQ